MMMGLVVGGGFLTPKTHTVCRMGWFHAHFPQRRREIFRYTTALWSVVKFLFFTQIYFENEPIKLQKKKKMQCELGCLLLAKI